MNKIVVSIGMAAVGASALQNASAQNLGAPDQSKFWSVTANLRGFYDDNINTAFEDGAEIETFGLEISPGIGLAWSNDQTTLSAGYRYSGKVYEEAPRDFSGSDVRPDKWDHNHNFRLSLDHAFSERYRLGLSDSFVVGQEPDSLRLETSGADSFQRLSGDNIRNYASIYLNAQLTPVFNAEVGYNNAYFNYDQSFSDDIQPFVGALIPSVSGTLDRVEHTAYLEGQLEVQPTTQLLAGYQFGVVDFTGDEAIEGSYFLGVPTVTQMSEDRNKRSHYGYLGVSHAFRPDFTGSIRGGVEVADFYNRDDNDTELSPYVQAVLNYAYAEESSLRIGFTQRRSAIYAAGALDADSSVVFGSIHHRIVPNLYGSLSGTFQHSEYNAEDGSALDGASDQLFQVGVSLEYRFTQNFATEVGYNFDHLNSDMGAVDRDYDRNRVYIGVIARY